MRSLCLLSLAARAITQVAAACATLLMFAHACDGSHKPTQYRPIRWLSAYRKMGGGEFYSPDRKYLLHVKYTLGQPFPEANIALFDVRNGGKNHINPLQQADPGFFHGVVWVPGHDHWLVFGSRGDPGYSMLGLWTGGHTVRSLHRRSDIGCDQDWFTVHAVSSDGRYLLYSWWTSDPPGEPKQDHWVYTLPRSDREASRLPILDDDARIHRVFYRPQPKTK